MSNFFKNIVEHSLTEEWAEALDWLLDDEKFKNKFIWSKGNVSKLTKQIKRLENISNKNYCCGSLKKLVFPKSRMQNIQIIFSCTDSECKDLIRHIRNGIAHGKTNFFNKNGELFIEIKDYKKDGKTQTALICFPMSYILKIHHLYSNIQTGQEKNKNQNRKAKTA